MVWALLAPSCCLSFPSERGTSALLSESQGLPLQGALLTQKGQEIGGEQAEMGQWVGESLVQEDEPIAKAFPGRDVQECFGGGDLKLR